jgi:hypothetical protein
LFAFRLALALGHSRPDALLRSLTAKEFLEWQAFYSDDPFGDQRADLRAGIVCSTMNNRWRGKNETPAQPIDFMPFRRQQEQTPEEMQFTLRSILGQVMAHGKK